VFGGTAGVVDGEEQHLDDTWALDVERREWRQLATGAAPPGRRGHSGFIRGDEFFIFGGYVGRQFGYLDPQVYSLGPTRESWRSWQVDGVRPILALTGCVNLSTHVIFFAGHDGMHCLKSLVVLHFDGAVPRSWQEVEVHGAVPAPRFCHGVAALSDDSIFVFGGTAEDDKGEISTTNDFFLLQRSPIGFESSVVRTCSGSTPAPRNGFTFVRHGLGFVLFGGGELAKKYYDETWVLDVELPFRIPVAADAALLGDLAGLLESGAMSDLVIEVQQKSFPVHRAILACRSEYFRTMLTGGFAEAQMEAGAAIKIPHLDPGVFAHVLRFLYTGDPDLGPGPPEAPDLLEAVAIGDLAGVRHALDSGADACEAGARGIAPAVIARVRGFDAAARELVGCGGLDGEEAVAPPVSGGGSESEAPDAKAEWVDWRTRDQQEQEETQLQMLFSLMAVADELALDGLANLCEARMLRHLRCSTLGTLLRAAEEFKCRALQQCCLVFLKRNRQRGHLLGHLGELSPPLQAKVEVARKCL